MTVLRICLSFPLNSPPVLTFPAQRLDDQFTIGIDGPLRPLVDGGKVDMNGVAGNGVVGRLLQLQWQVECAR